jgi:hypothetical protein
VKLNRFEALGCMSYPGYNPNADTVAALAQQLVDSAALVSIVINHLSGGDFADLPCDEQAAVHGSAHMVICDLLTELGARYQAADIATATAVLEAAIDTIAENIFAEDGPCLGCEGRGHAGRYRAKRR